MHECQEKKKEKKYEASMHGTRKNFVDRVLTAPCLEGDELIRIHRTVPGQPGDAPCRMVLCT